MRRSVIDYMLFGKEIEVGVMVVEDSGKLEWESNHNLIWSKVIWGRREVRRREQYKENGLGGISGGSVEEVFIGWEEEVMELKQELGGGIIEEVWSRWKEKVIDACYNEVRGMVVGGCGEVIVIRKMTCGKLREARKRRVGEITLSQLWKNYRRERK